MNQSITQFWYIIEQLTPFDLTQKLKESKDQASISSVDDPTTLPWLNSNLLSQKFKLPLYDDSGKLIEYSYRIYLGVFYLQLVFDFLQSLPKPVASTFEDLVTTSNNLSCFASFTIAHNGLLIDETLNYSIVPWSLKKVQMAFTSQKKFSLDSWTDESYKHIAHLKLLFSSVAKAKANHKMAVNDLQELYKSICLDPNQWQPEEVTYLGYYTIQKKKDSGDQPTDGDIINSFYLKDLEAVSTQANSNNKSIPLKQYLANDIPNRVPLEERTTVQHYLSPQYLPYGCWPSNPTNNLALMQQCAVNLAFDKLTKAGGIFSVNGPPGTGKTTLLRDLIANLIVERAECFGKYEEPSHAFSENDGIYCPDPAITGYEIVVASSNNGAVKNITKELPSFDSIDNQYHEQASYFRKVAESVKVKAQKQSNQLDDEELKKSVLEKDNYSVWGLIAAVLGNKENCNSFCEGFWWDKQNSIQSPLYGTDRPEQKKLMTKKEVLKLKQALRKWQAVRQDFQQKKQKVKQLIEQRQELFNLVRSHAVLSEEYTQIHARLQANEQLSFEKNQQQFSELQQKYDRQKRYSKKLNLKKPCFLHILFKTDKARQYQHLKDTTQQKLEDLTREIDNLDENQQQAKEDYQQVILEFAETQHEEQELRQTLDDLEVRLEQNRFILGDAFADTAWWERPHETLQLFAPWIDVELNEARTQLFLSALAVHEQFIRTASSPFLKNLRRWVDLVKGKGGDLKTSQVLDLWQTFFLVVPVISTTFASVERLFERVETESLGWLLY